MLMMLRALLGMAVCGGGSGDGSVVSFHSHWYGIAGAVNNIVRIDKIYMTCDL